MKASRIEIGKFNRYLNEFQDEGIILPIFDTEGKGGLFGDGFELYQDAEGRLTDQKPNEDATPHMVFTPTVSAKYTVDMVIVEKFYTRKRHHPDFENWLLKDFIDDELQYLESLSDGIKQDFRHIIKPLRKFLSEWVPEEKNQGVTRETEHFVIAAIHYYTDKPITATNCEVIAAGYGHKAKTSGKQLSDQYSKIDNEAYRLGRESNKKSNTHRKKQLIEASSFLTGEPLKKCLADIEKASR